MVGTRWSEPLHLLVYGRLDSGVTDSLRVGIFRLPLAELGVEMRSWLSFADDVLNGGVTSDVAGDRRPAKMRAADDALRFAGLTALAWADVVLFRRWQSTSLVCTECETAFASLGEIDRHLDAAGHRTIVPDPTLRPLVDLLARHPGLVRSKAIVYDTDDDVLDYPAWTGFAAAAGRERDLILRILGLADLVTVATPVLAGRLAGHTAGTVRVVRNAIDPAWYSGADRTAAPAAAGPRIVYHGVPVRLRDYEVARPAVDKLAGEIPGLRRVWIGAENEPRIVAAVDEVRPWVDGLAAFGASLAAERPDIGLAPLLDEPFNRAKSELHWIEYSLAGAATVATGFDGPGPYDPIRDGVDGLLARAPADWERHIRALATTPDLRAEIAGRARERVLAEYSIAGRAHEIADGLFWAAEHPGSGRRGGRIAGPGRESRRAADAKVGPRVLVIGPGAASASDTLRFDAMIPSLAGHGVELVNWMPGTAADSDPFGELEAALAWSDVVVLRRHYRTWHACLLCALRTLDAVEARGHAAATGHEVVLAPFSAIRPLVQLLESDPGVLGERALVYDTDDDLFSADLPSGAEDVLERDLVARILKLADLVTAATPVLAGRLRPHTASPIRVIRNAVDPAWYKASTRPLDLPGDPRVLYHGVPARLDDYSVARPALDALAAEMPSLKRIWLGSDAPEVAAVVDVACPWVAGMRQFAEALVASHPDIGIAPLADTPYNRSRSELHWLEYSMAGAPAIVTGFGDAGPYDEVRDGVDGLIARGPADWARHLRALAASPDLRSELAGRARERAVADFAVSSRAAEWADAYGWAAGHPGIGRNRRAE